MRNWSGDMPGKKTRDTENLHDCPKVCVKKADFRINATADYMIHASAMLLNTCNTNRTKI